MQETNNDRPSINDNSFRIKLKKKWFGRLKTDWYEDENTLDIISCLTGIIVLLLCILYYFLSIENQAYIHLTVGIGAGIVAGCEYQVARLFNKSYIPVWIGGVLCILNLLCFVGYIK